MTPFSTLDLTPFAPVRRALLWPLLLAVSLLVALGGPERAPRAPDARRDPAGHAGAMQSAEVARRFEQAVVMLHAKEYEHAITALHRVLQLAPTMPEAHVNMGFALLGLSRAGEARLFFDGAIDLRPTQANAYYGLALAYEALGELEAALGAMRSYLHLSRADDPYRSRARAALWEWERDLGRHATAPASRPAGRP